MYVKRCDIWWKIVSAIWNKNCKWKSFEQNIEEYRVWWRSVNNDELTESECCRTLEINKNVKTKYTVSDNMNKFRQTIKDCHCRCLCICPFLRNNENLQSKGNKICWNLFNTSPLILDNLKPWWALKIRPSNGIVILWF